MPNRIRPGCPKCGAKMAPLFRHGPRGKAFVRHRDAFACPTHPTILAQGRTKPQFLGD